MYSPSQRQSMDSSHESESMLSRLSTTESIPRSDIVESFDIRSDAPLHYQEHVDAADFRYFEEGSASPLTPDKATYSENVAQGPLPERGATLQDKVIDDIRSRRWVSAKEGIELLSRLFDTPIPLSPRVKALLRHASVTYDDATRTCSGDAAALIGVLRDAIRLHDTETLAVLSNTAALINSSFTADNYTGWTALSYAVKVGARDCVAALLAKDADPNEKINLRSGSGRDFPNSLQKYRPLLSMRRSQDKNPDGLVVLISKPLHAAALFGHIGSVKLLLESGADQNATNSKGETAMHLVLRRCKKNSAPKYHHDRPMAIVESLLEHKADINAKDLEGNTPLHAGLYGNNVRHGEFVDFMVSKGADISARNKATMTPLLVDASTHRLARDGQDSKPPESYSGGAALIKHGADVNVSTDDADGRNPLHYASGTSNTYLVSKLIEAGCQVNGRTAKAGYLPLFYAVTAGEVETARHLIVKHGADVNFSTKSSKYPTFAFAAVNSKKPELILELLVYKGAEVNNTRDGEGNTPLHLFASKGLTGCVRILLHQGRVFVNPKNNEGWTPTKCAKKNGKKETFAFLKTNGGKV